MATWGNCDFSELKQFAKRLEKLEDGRKEFCEACTREIAARFLRMVMKLTLPGKSISHMEDMTDDDRNPITYKKNSKAHKKGDVRQHKVIDHVGGTLRRGWTAKTEGKAEKGGAPVNPTKYVAGMRVNKRGAAYEIVVYNPVHYASYVEYGHRQLPGRYVPAIGKQLKQPWVKGKFMMTTTARNIQAAAPKVIEKKLNEWLERGMNGR